MNFKNKNIDKKKKLAPNFKCQSVLYFKKTAPAIVLWFDGPLKPDLKIKPIADWLG